MSEDRGIELQKPLMSKEGLKAKKEDLM